MTKEYNSPYQQGVGAVLTIGGETEGVKRMFDELSSRIATPLDRHDLHLTLVDAAETAVNVFSERDEIALRNTHTALASYLGSISYGEFVIAPSDKQLQKLGRSVCIMFENSRSIVRLREDVDEIIYDKLGERLVKRDFRPHVAIARLPDGRKRVSKDQPSVPKNMHVDGFAVGQRLFGFRRRVWRPSYVNHPRLVG